MNLGTGTGASVLKVIHAIEKCSGRKTSAVMAPRREGDPPELVADPRLAALGLSTIVTLRSASKSEARNFRSQPPGHLQLLWF